MTDYINKTDQLLLCVTSTLLVNKYSFEKKKLHHINLLPVPKSDTEHKHIYREINTHVGINLLRKDIVMNSVY